MLRKAKYKFHPGFNKVYVSDLEGVSKKDWDKVKTNLFKEGIISGGKDEQGEYFEVLKGGWEYLKDLEKKEEKKKWTISDKILLGTLIITILGLCFNSYFTFKTSNQQIVINQDLDEIKGKIAIFDKLDTGLITLNNTNFGMMYNGSGMLLGDLEKALNKTNPKLQETDTIVSYTIDGDTIKLNNGKKVRLIGINTPEEDMPCYSEAKNKLQELIDGKKIRLEKDISNKDRHGRLLRYVYINNLFVNLEMVRLGLATAYEYEPDTKYATQIKESENQAKQQKIGCLWKTEEKNYIEDNCISIINFHYDAEGNDNYNLNDEHITFFNGCNYEVDMTGWTIKDEATNIYRFPTFTFEEARSVTLYSGNGLNSENKLFWGGRSYAVWNNDGDTLYLRDSNGNLVLSYSY